MQTSTTCDPAAQTAAADEAAPEIRERALSRAPNPYDFETPIRFDMPGQMVVDLRILDPAGCLERSLMVGSALVPSSRTMWWNGRNDPGGIASGGVLFARLATPVWRGTQRIERLR